MNTTGMHGGVPFSRRPRDDFISTCRSSVVLTVSLQNRRRCWLLESPCLWWDSLQNHMVISRCCFYSGVLQLCFEGIFCRFSGNLYRFGHRPFPVETPGPTIVWSLPLLWFVSICLHRTTHLRDSLLIQAGGFLVFSSGGLWEKWFSKHARCPQNMGTVFCRWTYIMLCTNL